MIKQFAGIIILSGISFTALAKLPPPKKTSARPDIPGTFVVEFGFNQDVGGPSDFSLEFLGVAELQMCIISMSSAFLNPDFSFVPGIGLSMERFKFKNDYTLAIPPAPAANLT